MARRRQGSGAQSARWILGTLLFVQGFGSAVTQTLWGTSFGVAGLARAADLPQWTDLLLGAAGAVLLVWAMAWRHTTGREQADA
ncbi:hypothetical protein AB0L25_37705 [Spirillospora sp. NPDC052242]